MDKKILLKFAQNLEKEKQDIEKRLKKFANKDKDLKNDWHTRFPKLRTKEYDSSYLEQAADEVEEYGNLLPVEYSLELKLKDINFALKKIKSNKYGICEKCGKKIEEKRLKVYLEAKNCLKCK